MRKTVVLSGGFDPLHIGHVKMIEEAATLGRVVIILNNDNWLVNKKGYAFMKEKERKYILENIKGVARVVLTTHRKSDSDTSVVDALRSLRHVDIFANGGDRHRDNIPEYSYCESKGIEMVFNVGGQKAQSSSQLVKQASKHVGRTNRQKD